MKTLITKLFFVFSLFIVTLLYSQENFEKDDLAILEKVAFKATHSNIKSLMKENFYEFDEQFDDDGIDAYVFKGPYMRTVYVGFNGSKKLEAATIIIPTVVRVFADMELEEKNFEIISKSVEELIYKKDNYPYQFVTNTRGDNDKVSMIMLFTKESSSFEK